MTDTRPTPSIEITHGYPCGCVERWLVLHLPEDEPLHNEGKADCHRSVCTDEQAHQSYCLSQRE